MTNTHRIKYFLFQSFFSNKGRLVLIWRSLRTILPIFKDGVYWKIYRGFHEQVEPKKLERKRGGGQGRNKMVVTISYCKTLAFQIH